MGKITACAEIAEPCMFLDHVLVLSINTFVESRLQGSHLFFEGLAYLVRKSGRLEGASVHKADRLSQH